MLKHRTLGKRRLLALAAGCLLFALAVLGVFMTFQNTLNERFHTMLSDGLSKNTSEMAAHAEALLENHEELLAALAAEPAALADGQVLALQHGHIRVDYLPALPEGHAAALQAGETVVTGLGEAPCAEEGCFALLYPVPGADGPAGVLRARIDAALLVGGDIDPVSFFQKTYTILTQADGTVLYADTPYPDSSSDLFVSALLGGIGTEEVLQIKQQFIGSEAATIQFPGKGNDYYMSWATLPIYGWRIVRFARSPDLILQTQQIVRGMILAGLALIALTAAFCAGLVALLLQKKRRLEAQQRRYDALSQFNDTLLFEYDALTDRIIFTPNALDHLDLDSSSLEGISSQSYIQHLLHPDDREAVRRGFDPARAQLGEIFYLEARFRCRGGAYSWFGCQFKSIENRNGRSCRVVGKLVDISHQRGREQALRKAALADALTGVYNRSAETLITQQLEKDPHGLFFMIDLDNFKNVNDTYGHAVGDALLVQVAQILREVFRPSDIIARIGGDEFVAFIAGTSAPVVAQHKAAAIQSRLEALCIPGSEQPVSASIGAAICPQNGTSYGELTRAADEAMYSIKKNAKKGFALHQGEE